MPSNLGAHFDKTICASNLNYLRTKFKLDAHLIFRLCRPLIINKLQA